MSFPKKKLILINPVNSNRPGFSITKIMLFPPLGLAYIAALTPSHWDVSIWDENFNECTFPDADLIGISAYTGTSNRAYTLAAHYRKKKYSCCHGRHSRLHAP